MVKKISTILMALFLLFGFVSCRKKEVKAVTLEMLLSDDSLEGGAMSVLVKKFNAEYAEKGISVKINEIAYADIKTQIQNRAYINQSPALVKTTDFDSFRDYVYPLDDSTLKSADFVRNGSREGKFYATPVNSTAVGLIINKTAFDKAGVTYPQNESERWTWEQFLSALDTVMAKGGVKYGLVIDHSQQRLNTILYQFGMKYFDPDDKNKIVFSSPETKKGLDFILNLYKKGYSPKSVGLGAENAQSTFKTGEVAAHLAGNWVLNDYQKSIKDFEWTPVLMPFGSEKATSLGGNWLYVMKGTGV